MIVNLYAHMIKSVRMHVFYPFQDGSYSRGPVKIPVGVADDSKYFLSPTFKFEQVKIPVNYQMVVLHCQYFSSASALFSLRFQS